MKLEKTTVQLETLFTVTHENLKSYIMEEAKLNGITIPEEFTVSFRWGSEDNMDDIYLTLDEIKNVTVENVDE